MPPLALSIICSDDNNDNTTISNVLPYPELAYLTHSSIHNYYDRQRDPLGLIMKIIDSIEAFTMTVTLKLKF